MADSVRRKVPSKFFSTHPKSVKNIWWFFLSEKVSALVLDINYFEAKPELLSEHFSSVFLFNRWTAFLMRHTICTKHVGLDRISHRWQVCWYIKDTTFYPDNSANSGGQLTPSQWGPGEARRNPPSWAEERSARRCWCARGREWKSAGNSQVKFSSG